MVTADELAQIQRRMAEAGITNAGAYMRKMALVSFSNGAGCINNIEQLLDIRLFPYIG